ncbi:MAG TPA: hypothetical protein VJW73_07035, partial [Gemmatimonadaceae bacterium]|nr:hypothetical protein [Gemmatimonadaceae bacterium]
TGECMACGAPEQEAPDLLSPLTDDDLETYFIRQPSTPDDVDRACRAAMVCCVSAVRYRGQDPTIIRRLGNTAEYCDFVVGTDGELRPAPLWHFASLDPARRRRWWQLWRRDHEQPET